MSKKQEPKFKVYAMFSESEIREIASSRVKTKTDWFFPAGVTIGIAAVLALVGAVKEDTPDLILLVALAFAFCCMCLGFSLSMYFRRPLIKAKMEELKHAGANETS